MRAKIISAVKIQDYLAQQFAIYRENLYRTCHRFWGYIARLSLQAIGVILKEAGLPGRRDS